jgi:hypothetical protein
MEVTSKKKRKDRESKKYLLLQQCYNTVRNQETKRLRYIKKWSIYL